MFRSRFGTKFFRLLLIALLVQSSIAIAESRLQKFPTESAAQAHCPSDTVVWLNSRTGIYHEKGMRWYGRTKHGAYVCQREADSSGNRDTRNEQ
jgi:hypothetical protein